jgi:inorganic triphosphatase YgiF
VPNIAAIEDAVVRRTIEKATCKRELGPLFTVEMERTSVVLTPKRGTDIEAAFDLGTIKTVGGRLSVSAPVVEFELELLKGNAVDLVACAKELTAGLPLVLGLQSKAARGYALAEDTLDAAVTARRVTLGQNITADEAFAQVLSHCLSHLLGNFACITRTREPEGIHQMRVAVRRMRSAFVLFNGSFRLALRALEEEVRWLADVLGHARDLDVFQEDVFRPAADAHGEDERLLELATVVRTRRRIAWHNVLEALESERFRKLVLDLAGVTFSRPWLDGSLGGEGAIEPADEFSRERLAHKHGQAMKLGRRIDELDAGDRHELRKRLKKLRYAVEFFASLYPKRAVKKYLRRLSDLQDVLGEMNDATVARALVRDILSEHGDSDGAAAIGYAGGVVAGWHLGHARERAKTLEKRWKKFAKLKPPWA